MPTMTDEEKAALIASGETPKNEPEKEDISQPEEEVEVEGQEAETEPEKPTEVEAPDQPTFTKQFSNLRGDSWEEYGPEVEKAYQNSFTEALRLDRELKEAQRIIANMPAIQNAGQPSDQPAQSQQVHTPTESPEIQYAKTLMQRDMRQSFDKFSEEYPQVKDEANFTKFRDAATPVGQAYIAVEGREPTYDELFPKIAAVLGWRPVEIEGKHDQALKESLSQGHAASGQSRSIVRKPRVSDAQVDAYLRMFPAKNRADAVKELEEAFI